MKVLFGSLGLIFGLLGVKVAGAIATRSKMLMLDQ